MDKTIPTYQQILPPTSISDYVESFWVSANNTDENKEILILPDGRIELFFTISEAEQLNIYLLKLQCEALTKVFKANTMIYAISFKLIALEYLFNIKGIDFTSDQLKLPEKFWDITKSDLNSFDKFTKKVISKIEELTKIEIETRKKILFQNIYSSNGSITVQELSKKSYWQSREINRYFNKQFGLTLKNYCQILRFRATFPQIKNGVLFPEDHFYDQSHFIRQIRKFSGLTPKKLNQNENDRFIQFSTLTKK